MNNKKVSVIIPALNEEEFIGETINSLRANNLPVEIIVVVNGSNDKTFEISKNKADKVLNFKEAIGPSAARNEGGKIASGDIFIFLDADTKVSDDAVGQILGKSDGITVGVCAAKVDWRADKKLRAKIFTVFKNFIHKTNIYRGSIAIIFCNRQVFFNASGFDKNMWMGELGDFIKRAIKSGANYQFLNNCFVSTSFRRYEKKWGYVKAFTAWIKWIALSPLNINKNIEKEYFKR